MANENDQERMKAAVVFKVSPDVSISISITGNWMSLPAATLRKMGEIADAIGSITYKEEQQSESAQTEPRP